MSFFNDGENDASDEEGRRRHQVKVFFKPLMSCQIVPLTNLRPVKNWFLSNAVNLASILLPQEMAKMS